MVLLKAFLPYILGAVGTVAVAGSIYWYIYNKGADSARQQVREDTIQEILRTDERISDGLQSVPNRPDGAREWLRRRNEDRGLR